MRLNESIELEFTFENIVRVHSTTCKFSLIPALIAEIYTHIIMPRHNVDFNSAYIINMQRIKITIARMKDISEKTRVMLPSFKKILDQAKKNKSLY